MQKAQSILNLSFLSHVLNQKICEVTHKFFRNDDSVCEKIHNPDKNVNVHFIFSLSLFIMDLKKIEAETFFYDLLKNLSPQITSDSDDYSVK